MGVGDQVPPAIEQLGAKVEMISADDLAWGNLSRFDAIVTGVRAYERRDDLRANNRRLLDYVSNGGTVIVQYNKFEFNDAQYGPYPGEGQLEPRHRRERAGEGVETRRSAADAPNEIGEAAWKNWVQERGLYFLGETRTRATTTCCSSKTISVQQGAEDRRAGRDHRTAKAAGSTSGSACGGSCRRAPMARISCWRT